MSDATTTRIQVAQMLPGAFFAEHRAEVSAAMLRVLDSGWYILGEEVRHFEEEFAAALGYTAAVGVANGTDALALALKAIGVQNGDRVATVSHTAVATVAAIEMAGALPVLVDIDSHTCTMSPDSLRRTLHAVGGVKAVIPVHLYGHPADMPAILNIAREFDARVTEDCSQAHGAALNARPVGSMGDMGTFSFYPTKNLGAMGDGGMVVTGDPELAARIRSLREYGWQQRYVSQTAGVNSRLDELQAALLRTRLPYLQPANDRRRRIAAAYSQQLNQTGLSLPHQDPQAHHVFHQYVVRSPHRDQLKLRLAERGIGTNIHYPVPVHLQPAYIGRCLPDPAGLPVTEQAAATVLSLPMYPELKDDQVSEVIAAVKIAHQT